jgi:phosphoglycolate phosphatase
MTPAPFLVFDLDGTISDPAVGIGRSINYALEHYGYAVISEDEVPRFIGPPLDISFASITGNSSPDHVAALVSKYRERYADVGYSENILYSGVPEALEALVSAGVSIGLCTSKRVDFANSILRLFGLRQHFHFLSGGDIGIHKKQQLAALLSDRTISSTSIMIGDRAFDIEAAKSNGLKSVGVLWGHGSVEELVAAGPSSLLEFPHQLTELKYAV